MLDAHTGALVREGRAGHPDRTEVHPDHWWRALSQALDDAGGLAGVSALSVGGQQHGMVLLDRGGNVLRPALLWNDTRSAESAAALTDEVGAEDRRPPGWRSRARGRGPSGPPVALPHDWLTWRLRGYGPTDASPLGPDLEQLTTDRSDASGTGYWNPATGDHLAALG
ncbi:FGGY family carbohydrate kinase, partial [Arthrobacter sp. ISL-65]|uniref:FGGY family carbohydrate kinase n=1 Tax=Arthrobacter sp. ISL-65 TaxID=2819112 RepID=UPI001C1363E1